MELRGTRCTVRPWGAGDGEALVRHADNAAVARHLRDRFPHPYTMADARAFLSSLRADEQGTRNLAIDVEGEAVGGIGFSRGDDIERYSAEIGYWLGERYWSRGIATEALLLVTEGLFERGNLLRLFAVPFADNTASVRVLEKAGYTREALLRWSAVKHGAPRDQLLYARVNTRWKGVAIPAGFIQGM